MEFPNLGEHCSEQSCNRLDFLPLRCDACKSTFCTDHISYLHHSCHSAYKKDVQVPVCPLCNAPIPSKRGDPPDLAVNQHMDNDCQIQKDRRKVFINKCSQKGCKIKEIVRVNCTECSQNYCLKHRHPTDHTCPGKEAAIRAKRLNALNSQGQNKNSAATNGNSIWSLKNLQGQMSEDEALARALQASLQDEERTRRQGLQPVPSSSRDRCSLS
ncbi:AN1-type zinc finger protein 2A [Belonocnema kinseyi]|uniref:AN1-type zinc finger protein 2A n=1 Tax=Belonocnema kinseyi TaxID=2817044 RepID=UPI00143D2180|nr:AN1-type zinc finger protein 2A [Belonocnema kinseyi]